MRREEKQNKERGKRKPKKDVLFIVFLSLSLFGLSFAKPLPKVPPNSEKHLFLHFGVFVFCLIGGIGLL